MPFGKHEGKYFSEIKATDVPYCQWCLNTAVALPLTCHHMLKLLAIYYDLKTSCAKFWLLTTTWYYDMEPMLKAAAPRPENVRIQHSNGLLELKQKLKEATDLVVLQFAILRRLAASTASSSSSQSAILTDEAMLQARNCCQEAMGNCELQVLNMLDMMSPRSRAKIVKQQEAMAQAASSASLLQRLVNGML
jgi:hypothetical protein